jgi:hypothetical protein
MRSKKQVVMQFLLDNDVETPANEQQYPVTELVRTYLQRSGSKFFGIASARREQVEPRSARDRAQDLWDYLGDFA